ncbi:MAG TPA: ornithine carbamoyltransferase [Anaerolineaceae bacterium]
MGARSLKGRDVLSLCNFTAEEIDLILNTSLELKRGISRGERQDHILCNKAAAMIFETPSSRTRMSFWRALQQLGGAAEDLSGGKIWSDSGVESWGDTVRVMDRYFDVLVARMLAQSTLEEAAGIAQIPVFNASTDYEHPFQALADFQTVLEKKGRFDNVKYVLTWAYHEYNPPMGLVTSSMYLASRLQNFQFVLACPEEYTPPEDIVQNAKHFAEENGASVEIVHDMKEAAKGADFINAYSYVMPADFRAGLKYNWQAPVPHNQEPERFKSWIVNDEIMAAAKPGAKFMHCMPAAVGHEVTADVIYGPNSIIQDEAENRLHVQKAVLALVCAS